MRRAEDDVPSADKPASFLDLRWNIAHILPLSA